MSNPNNPPQGSSSNPNNSRGTIPYNTPPSYYRRSSYASVVAGITNAPSNSAGPATLHQIPQTRPYFMPVGDGAPNSASMAFSAPAASHRPSGAPSRTDPEWARPASVIGLGSYGPPFTGFGGMAAMTSNDIHQLDDFFIPTYLQNTRYAERLREAHHSRIQSSQIHSRSRAGSQPASLSTSSSSVNLHNGSDRHKMVPSHRGLSHDIVEHPPQPMYMDSSVEDPPLPLPSRWNPPEKNLGLELYADGLQVRFSGTAKPQHDEAACVRADHPMPKMAGIYYFEIQIQSKLQREGLVSVGFCGPKSTMHRLPGWEPDSWAYHGDDGCIYHGAQQGKAYGAKFSGPNTVGCGVNFRLGTVFFTKDGVMQGTAFKDIKGEFLYPSIGMKKPNEHIKANFGQTPFVFDIEGMIERERKQIMEDIRHADTANLYPPLTESQLLHKLVAQYLAHNGFVSTARSFAYEVAVETAALAPPGSTESRTPVVEEDKDAVNRQKIRKAIMSGNIDAALHYAEKHYPSVLIHNTMIHFRLKCLKFIELLRASIGGSAQSSEKRRGKRRETGSNTFDFDDDEDEDAFNHEMDIDGDDLPLQQHTNGGAAPQPEWGSGSAMHVDSEHDGLYEDPPEHIDVPSTNNSKGKSASNGLLPITNQDLIDYGTQLKAEYDNDSRREIKDELRRMFGLMIYPNPKDSALKDLFEVRKRMAIAEELNGAILVSLGKSSSAALERLVQQTEIMLRELGDDGGPGALLNLRMDYMSKKF